jgi:DnaJ domain
MNHNCTIFEICARSMQELIAEWRKEMSREAADFSKPDALSALALSSADLEGAATPEDTLEVLKRAYRKQALKLHPDKCPDGPEPFLKMQAAYKARSVGMTLLCLVLG